MQGEDQSNATLEFRQEAHEKYTTLEIRHTEEVDKSMQKQSMMQGRPWMTNTRYQKLFLIIDNSPKQWLKHKKVATIALTTMAGKARSCHKKSDEKIFKIVIYNLLFYCFFQTRYQPQRNANNYKRLFNVTNTLNMARW